MDTSCTTKETVLPNRPSRSPSYHLSRETSFYHEAWLASESYLLKLGNELVNNYGFRAVSKSDKTLLGLREETIDQRANAEEYFVSLIATASDPHSPSSDQHLTNIHLIQLPYNLSALLGSIGTASLTLTSDKTVRRNYFTCISPSAPFILTPSSLSINPLRDLVHFLQCLLPPAAALALSPLPSTCKSPIVAKQDRTVTTTLVSDETHRVNVSPLDHTTPPINVTATWLDRNEALLRDTVGCSYFRHLREVAV